jgi:hypothetical protein
MNYFTSHFAFLQSINTIIHVSNKKDSNEEKKMFYT